MKNILLIVALALLLPIGASGSSPSTGQATSRTLTGRSAAVTTAPLSRPGGWATPLEHAGLPNFFKVSDSLYRGAQPSAEGFRQLKKLGIKTVISLRAYHSDTALAAGSGLVIEDIHFNAWHPENEDIIRFLRLLSDKNRQPIFVHCQFGADRTGTMCAIYRIVVEGWSRDEAIKEMTRGGFRFHGAWANLVQYINHLDIEQIRKEAGLCKPLQPTSLPPAHGI